jgi:hypothetical protein
MDSFVVGVSISAYWHGLCAGAGSCQVLHPLLLLLDLEEHRLELLRLLQLIPHFHENHSEPKKQKNVFKNDPS